MAMIEVNWRPDDRTLRSFGWICLIAFALIGGWIYLRQSFLFITLSPAAAQWSALAFGGLALLGAVLGTVAPRTLWPLYVACPPSPCRSDSSYRTRRWPWSTSACSRPSRSCLASSAATR